MALKLPTLDAEETRELIEEICFEEWGIDKEKYEKLKQDQKKRTIDSIKPYVHWYPSELETFAAICYLLAPKEKDAPAPQTEWLNHAITSDPALYTKPIAPALYALKKKQLREHSGIKTRVKSRDIDVLLLQRLKTVIGSLPENTPHKPDALQALPKWFEEGNEWSLDYALHALETQLSNEPGYAEIIDAVDRGTGFTQEQIRTLQSALEEDEDLKSMNEKQKNILNDAIRLFPEVDLTNYKEIVREVLLYQGLHAVAWHRIAHEKFLEGNYSEARKISQGARHITGIEIHPGAEIGKNCFIDHGMGVVIGETATIGDNAQIFQGVTLGNKDKVKPGERRHPKIGDNVALYAGACVNGAATIEDDVIIGAYARIIGGKSLKIGKGAQIDPGLTIRKSVEAGDKIMATTQYGSYPIPDTTDAMKTAARYDNKQKNEENWAALVDGTKRNGNDQKTGAGQDFDI